MIIYEAVFLNNEAVEYLFKLIRGKKPHANKPKDYHVTMAFKPETTASHLYGKLVAVHVIGYKDAEIATRQGMTHNEGFKVEVSSTDPEMAKYIAENKGNFHITGSFEDKPVYTGFIDFSDAKSVNFTLFGTFGAFTSEGNIIK